MTCSPEDLIVHKALAGRAQDWVDIESIIVRQKQLDSSLIASELAPLVELKEDSETMPRLQELFRENGNEAT